MKGQLRFEELRDEEIRQIADSIMNNLMDASTRIDHEAHTRDFTDRIKAIVTKEHLEKVCRKYQEERGYFAGRQFLALLRRPGAVAVLWKQKFTKVEGDFVAEMLLVEQEGEYLVDHVMVW